MVTVLIEMHLNVINWVNVFHCILHYAPDLHENTHRYNKIQLNHTNLFKTIIAAQGSHCVALYKNVAASQKLNSLLSHTKTNTQNVHHV